MVKAQILTVLNLDKCIGCHTCSVSCKKVWSSRKGVEYAWFNNVETKPGVGYPKEWENQSRWLGGWQLNNDELSLAQGGRLKLLSKIFYNPKMPEMSDYAEPYRFDYSSLFKGAGSEIFPTLRPQSEVTNETIDEINWGVNWEDSLGGEFDKRKADYNFRGMDTSDYNEFENTFMMYLPRLCEHCLNPACAASCPSGAIYKRGEDGAVLVDPDKCSGWRMCVSGCPYKKIYYNWKSGKAEKCIQCYPKMESGECSICSDSCVGRIRYQGVVLYDVDRVKQSATSKDAYESHLDIILDPYDEDVIKRARESGVAENWIDHAKRSPVYKMAKEWKVAFPLHPEYRTLPMVWYIPPLSAVKHGSYNKLEQSIENMRIPLKYLANLFTAGEQEPIKTALQSLLNLREYRRKIILNQGADPDKVLDEMYKLLAVAKYEDRFVIPTAGTSDDFEKLQASSGFKRD